jgi:Transglutaminase-like superfamily
MRYDIAGPLTTLASERLSFATALPADPVLLCRCAQGLVIQPDLATAVGISDERLAEKSIRPADDLLAVVLQHDDAPLYEAREPKKRVVGTCRHFSVLSCALMRAHGIAARSRCGFAGYFKPGQHLDHWITEYWHTADRRWVRVDSEIFGLTFVAKPDDLEPGQFLAGGEAWARCRRGEADPSRFGVDGAPHAWGIGEVRGNAIRDLAALNKIEMLPWDEWGRMDASYKGNTGSDFDDLMDTIATTNASDDSLAIIDLYGTEDLAVPEDLIA